MGGCVSRARSSHLAAFQFTFSGKGARDVPGGPEVRTLFLLQGAQIWSLVQEGRSRMPGDAAERICF